MADLRFNVSAETRQATAALGSFAQTVQKQLVQAVRALPNIEITADSSDAEKSMARIRGEMAKLANQKVGVDISAEDALAEVDRLQRELADLSGSMADVSIRANADQAAKSLDAIQSQVRQLDGDGAEVEVTADTAPAESRMDNFKEGLKTSAAAAAVGAGAILSEAFAQNLEIGEANAKFQAQLGVNNEFSAEMGRVAGDLYANAYGDGLGDVQQAMRMVADSGMFMDDVSAEAIGNITAKTMSLASAFDQDLNGSINAVAQMVKTGLARDGEQALDILTRGLQQGADKAGDLMDTFNEYGTQFRKLGLDGGTAMGLISQGLNAGARDADIAADALKEFSIRAIDGSKTTADGFKAIGLNAEQMAARISKGGPDAAAALDLTLDRLRSMKNPTDQAAAAVALFGTQAEDMGQALYALDVTSAVDQLGQVEGAAAKLDQTMGETAQAKVTALQRGFESWTQSLIATEGPIGDVSAYLAAFGPTAMTAVSAIAPLVLALKMQGVAKAVSEVSTSVDGVGGAADRTSKKVGEKGGGGLLGKLGTLAAAAGAAYVALDSLSNIDLKLPEPDQSYWGGFTSQAESNLSQVGDMFDSIMSANFSKFTDQWSNYWAGGGANIPLTVDAQAAWQTASAFITGINQTGATVNVDGNTKPLGSAVMTVMDAIAIGHATVTIDGQTLPAQEALNLLRDRINAEKGQVTINGTTVPAGDALFQVLANINAASGTLEINGDQTKASEALDAIKAAIDAGQGTVTINGDALPAEDARKLIESAINNTAGFVTINGRGTPAADALRQIEDLINKGGGIVTIDGQSYPADVALQLVKGRIDNTTGRLTIDGNPGPANAQTAGAVSNINRSSGTVSVYGNTGPLNSAVQGAIAYWNGRQINVAIGGSRVTAGGGLLGYAGGGMVPSGPGARVSRSSGMVIPGFAPGVDDVPIVASRGEAVLVPEAVRMLGGRRILAMNAEASSGRAPTIVGQVASMMDGVIGPSAGRAPAMAGGGMVVGRGGSSLRIGVPATAAAAGSPMAARVAAAVGTAAPAAAGGALRVVDDAARAEIHALRADLARRTGEQAMAGALRSLTAALAARQSVPAAADAQSGLSRSALGAW